MRPRSGSMMSSETKTGYSGELLCPMTPSSTWTAGEVGRGVGGGVLGAPYLVAWGDVDTYDWARTPRPGAREQPVADRTGDGLFMPEDPVLLAHLEGDEVEGMLVEGAAFHGIQGAVGGVGVLLELALEAVHRHRLARALGADQQQQPALHGHGVGAEGRHA